MMEDQFLGSGSSSSGSDDSSGDSKNDDSRDHSNMSGNYVLMQSDQSFGVNHGNITLPINN